MRIQKISSNAAFCLVLNAMLGAGVFLNLANLTKAAGSLGFAFYFVSFLAYFPIIYSLGYLAQNNSQAGGMFFQVSSNLGSLVGALSTWMYFVSRVVSSAALCHATVLFLLPVLQQFIFLSQHPI